MTISEKTWHMECFVKVEFYVWLISSSYHRAKPHSSFRPTVRFVLEIQRFVCDRATPPIIEKLQSKCVAMHVCGVSAYYALPGNQLNGPGQSRSK